MKIVAIIPARYNSSRFPGKPLADIGGMSMINRVYSQAAKVFSNLYVATDDIRIFDEVKRFGGLPVMTSQDHQNGTSRVLEAMYKIERERGEEFDIVVNVQGDEPFIEPEQFNELLSGFDDSNAEIVTLVKKFEEEEDILNRNTPKVVFNRDRYALYFSRSPIPYVRECFEKEEWSKHFQFYKHVGIYGYKRNTLVKICNLQPSGLELAENLEQLRWLESGFTIKVSETNRHTYAIDTLEDIEKILPIFARDLNLYEREGTGE